MSGWRKILGRERRRDGLLEAEIDEEIRFHVDMRTQSNLESGMDPQQARQDALRRFGNPASVRMLGQAILAERQPRRVFQLLEDFWRDLRFGLRQLFRNPGFAALSILTLALGIGANTAIFSLVDAVLLKPLPFPDDDRLVLVWEKPPHHERNSVTPLTFLDWRRQNQVFQAMSARTDLGMALTGGESPQQVTAALVTFNYFEVLGVQAALGRTFGDPEWQALNTRVAVLSHRLWQSRYGGRPDLVGSSIQIAGSEYTVLGILPAWSVFDRAASQIYLPFVVDTQVANRSSHFLRVYARLKEDVSLGQALSAMQAIAAGIAERHPDTNRNWSVAIDPLRQHAVQGDLRRTLLVLFGAVFLVLLIACLNVANLNLVRSADRRREVSIRWALGAGRLRLLRQHLCESLILALSGGALGILTGYWMLELLMGWMPPATLPAEADVAVDGRLLGFTLAVSMLTGLLFGSAPAWQSWRQDPDQSLKESGRANTFSKTRRQWGSALMVAEAALAVVLLVGSGLLLRSLLLLQQTESGFDPRNVLTLQLSLTSQQQPNPAAFFEQMLDEIHSLSGVESAALVSDLPLTGWTSGIFFQPQGAQPVEHSRRPTAHYQRVSPGYFRTLSIPILRGRDFSAADSPRSAPVAIINRRLADLHFAGRNPLGLQLEFGPSPQSQLSREIVGVVDDVRVYGLEPQSALETPEIYIPFAQSPIRVVSVAVRTSGDPLQMARAVERRIHSIDSNQPVVKLRSMEQVVSASLSEERFFTLLLGGFAAIALLLAMVGIYSVVSYSVSRLTRQIGIRKALGAADRHVLQLITRQAMLPVLAGIVIGLASSLALGGLLDRMLYGVSPSDPATFAAAPLLLAAAALLAAYLPGRRARSVDPIVALRCQ